MDKIDEAKIAREKLDTEVMRINQLMDVCKLYHNSEKEKIHNHDNIFNRISITPEDSIISPDMDTALEYILAEYPEAHKACWLDTTNSSGSWSGVILCKSSSLRSYYFVIFSQDYTAHRNGWLVSFDDNRYNIELECFQNFNEKESEIFDTILWEQIANLFNYFQIEGLLTEEILKEFKDLHTFIKTYTNIKFYSTQSHADYVSSLENVIQTIRKTITLNHKEEIGFVIFEKEIKALLITEILKSNIKDTHDIFYMTENHIKRLNMFPSKINTKHMEPLWFEIMSQFQR